ISRPPPSHLFPTRRSSDLPPFRETLRGKEAVTNRLSSSRTFIFITGLAALTAVRIAAAAAELEFDHVWIVVSRDAPERAALERRSEEHTSELQSRFDLVCR